MRGCFSVGFLDEGWEGRCGLWRFSLSGVSMF